MEKSNLKTEERWKTFRSEELSERIIEEVVKRIKRVPTNSLTDKALEVMRGISKSPFALWIVQEVKPKEFNPSALEKFNGKSDLVAHLLKFKQRISLEKIIKGLTCKLFSTNFTGRALSWFSQFPEGLVPSFKQFGKVFLEQY